jgi:hypothetical protein
MCDGTTQGMHFDEENRRADSVVEFETGMAYANAGNLRLELADFLRATSTPSAGSSRFAEIETERQASQDELSLAKIGYPVAVRRLTLAL